MAEADIHAVAGLLKLYLRDLPEPLFTDDLYPKFVEANGRPVCFGFVFPVMIASAENSIYRFRRLEKCCSVHESWNYDGSYRHAWMFFIRVFYMFYTRTNELLPVATRLLCKRVVDVIFVIVQLVNVAAALLAVFCFCSSTRARPWFLIWIVNCWLYISGIKDPEEKKKAMMELFESLPAPNRHTSIYLLDHLRRYVTWPIAPVGYRPGRGEKGYLITTGWFFCKDTL